MLQFVGVFLLVLLCFFWFISFYRNLSLLHLMYYYTRLFLMFGQAETQGVTLALARSPRRVSKVSG